MPIITIIVNLYIHQQPTPYIPTNTFLNNIEVQIHKLPPLHKLHQPPQRRPPYPPRHLITRMQHQIRLIRRILNLSLPNQRRRIAADNFPNHSRSTLQQTREHVRALQPATVVRQAERLV